MNLVHCLVVAGNRGHCTGSQRITIMPSVLTDIAVQIAAGIVAGNTVALAVKEYSLGIVKSTVIGTLGGIGSYLLEAVIPPTVTAAGDPVMDDSAVNEWVIRALLAFVVGGMLSLIVGYVKSETR
jgi:hypothetical protein